MPGKGQEFKNWVYNNHTLALKELKTRILNKRNEGATKVSVLNVELATTYILEIINKELNLRGETLTPGGRR